MRRLVMARNVHGAVEVCEIGHANKQSRLCKFAAEGTEKAYSKWLSKLKMTSVQCTYFLFQKKKKPRGEEEFPAIDDYNLDKTAPPPASE